MGQAEWRERAGEKFEPLTLRVIHGGVSDCPHWLCTGRLDEDMGLSSADGFRFRLLCSTRAEGVICTGYLHCSCALNIYRLVMCTYIHWSCLLVIYSDYVH